MAALNRFSLSRHLTLARPRAVRSFASTSIWHFPARQFRKQADDNPETTPTNGRKSGRAGFVRHSQDHKRPSSQQRPSGNSKRATRDDPSTDTQPMDRGGNPTKMATRIVIPDIARFYSRNGTLATTPENAQFFRETGIETDHGLLWNLTHRDADKFRKMGIEVSFSNRYVVNPYHLRAFAPRGDSWAANRRQRYKSLLENEPLWVHSLVPWSPKPAAVRQTCSRRLAFCTRRAAELLAQEDPPVLVRGTVLISVRDAILAVNMPAQEFQDMMVKALRKEMQDLDKQARTP